MCIAICKCLDFLIGFVIGYASDNLKSRWGRRKPFIMIMFPIWVVVMLLLFNPAFFFKDLQPPSSGHCARYDSDGGAENATLYPATSGYPKDSDGTVTKFGAEACPALATCVAGLMAGEGQNISAAAPLPYWDSSNLTAVNATTGLSYLEGPEIDAMSAVVYFAVLYFMFFSVGYSSTIIPYDALGMELTDDHDDRAALFGCKGFFQFLGYLVLAAMLLTFSSVFAKDQAKQNLFPSLIWGSLVTASFIILLLVLKERKLADHDSATVDDVSLPIVPQIRQLFHNKEYITYLWLKIPLSIASLVPVNLLPYYLKILQEEENSSFQSSLITGIVVLTSLIATPIIVTLSRKYGKHKTMFWICAMEAVFFLVGGLYDLPAGGKPMRYVTYVFGVFVGIGLSGASIIPDALLGDIIDYDELHTGRRNEAIYTVVETNLQQFVEIPSGTLPLILFSAAGYYSNGNCECGCGIKCADPFVRWHCTDPVTGQLDIGYACSSDLGAPLLYGNVTRDPPCVDQNDGVKWAVRVFFMMLPSICYALCCFPLRYMKIGPKEHAAIVANTVARYRGEAATDPLTDEDVRPIGNVERTVALEHFSGREQRFGSQNGVRSLFKISGTYFAFWMALFIAMVAMMAAVASEEAITFGSLICAVALVMIPWEFLRLKYLYGNTATVARFLATDEVEAHAAAVRKGSVTLPPPRQVRLATMKASSGSANKVQMTDMGASSRI